MRAREFCKTKTRILVSAFNSKFNKINSYCIFTSELQHSYYREINFFQIAMITRHAGKEFYI